MAASRRTKETQFLAESAGDADHDVAVEKALEDIKFHIEAFSEVNAEFDKVKAHFRKMQRLLATLDEAKVEGNVEKQARILMEATKADPDFRFKLMLFRNALHSYNQKDDARRKSKTKSKRKKSKKG